MQIVLNIPTLFVSNIALRNNYLVDIHPYSIKFKDNKCEYVEIQLKNGVRFVLKFSTIISTLLCSIYKKTLEQQNAQLEFGLKLIVPAAFTKINMSNLFKIGMYI